MPFRNFGNFLRDGAKIPVLNNPAADGPVLEFGEITKLAPKKLFRADVRTLAGNPLANVRLPGYLPDKSGRPDGFKFPYRKGQLVLVAYINNNVADPVVVQSFPFPAGEISKLNLSKMQVGTDYDHDEISVSSGTGSTKFRTKWDHLTGQVQFQNMTSGAPIPDLILDHTAKQLIIGAGVQIVNLSGPFTIAPVAGFNLSAPSGPVTITGDSITETSTKTFVMSAGTSMTLTAPSLLLGGPLAIEGVAKGTTLDTYLTSLNSWLTGLATWAGAQVPSFPGGPPPAPPTTASGIVKTL